MWNEQSVSNLLEILGTGSPSEEPVPKFSVDLGEVLQETGISGDETYSIFTETAQAKEAGSVLPEAREASVVIQGGAKEADVVVMQAEPIHQVMVFTQDQVQGGHFR